MGVLALLLVLLFVIVALACIYWVAWGNNGDNSNHQYHAMTLSTDVSGGMGLAQEWPEFFEEFHDALVNKNHRFWTAQRGAGQLVLFNCSGKVISPKVNVPIATSPPAGSTIGSPNGIAINTNETGWNISDFSVTEPSHLLVVTEDGQIGGYNALVDPNNVIITIDASGLGKVFKGCAVYKSQLFVTNFSDRVVEVYDPDFALSGTFTDSELVTEGLTPFNVAIINKQVFVSFVPFSGAAEPSAIDIFDLTGSLIKRLIHNEPHLSLPYGMVRQGNRLVVANGVPSASRKSIVNEYDLKTGAYRGTILCGSTPAGIFGLVARGGRHQHRSTNCTNIFFYLSEDSFGELAPS